MNQKRANNSLIGGLAPSFNFKDYSSWEDGPTVIVVL